MTDDGPEALGERLASVIADLGGVERDGPELRSAGRLFAVVAEARLEVLLDPLVASAAQRTPDAGPSPRGPGWVLFTPATADRFALDRAEAWLRSAHRLASGPAARPS